jgi:hypothetical protein
LFTDIEMSGWMAPVTELGTSPPFNAVVAGRKAVAVLRGFAGSGFWNSSIGGHLL